MKLQDRSLTMQFVSILAIGMVLLGVSAGYGISRLSELFDAYDQALHRQVSEQQQILIIVADFKKQVQEWKNVLLRGQEPQKLEKYWGQFVQKEQEIQDKVSQLIPKLTNPQAKQQLEAFLAAHRKMQTAYRSGLESFKASGFDPHAGGAQWIFPGSI